MTPKNELIFKNILENRPDQYRRARFFLMQQVAHIFYAMVFLLLGSSGRPIDWSETVPDFRDFHRRIWAGEVDLEDSHTKIIYGKVHWEQLSQNVRQARFDEALRIVSAWILKLGRVTSGKSLTRMEDGRRHSGL